MKCSLTFLGFVCMISSAANAQGGDRSTSVRLTVTTPLEYVNTPLDPTIDFGEYVAQSRSPGVFDPNSIVVQDVTTGERVPHALSEDFAYADRGRVELVIVDPTHVTYDIRFSTIPVRKLIEPQAEFPAIGVGDLLRYNAGVPRPITTFYSMCLHDLNGDGSVGVDDAVTLAHWLESISDLPNFLPLIGGVGIYDSTAYHGPFVHVDARGSHARWGLWPK